MHAHASGRSYQIHPAPLAMSNPHLRKLVSEKRDDGQGSGIANIVFGARQCTIPFPSIIPEHLACPGYTVLAVVVAYASLPLLDPLGPAVRPIQSCNLSGYGGPLQVTSGSISSSLGHQFIPFHQFVYKPQMWLNDHIESSRPHKAVGSWKAHILALHNLSYANCRGAGNANATMDQCCTSICLSTA